MARKPTLNANNKKKAIKVLKEYRIAVGNSGRRTTNETKLRGMISEGNNAPNVTSHPLTGPYAPEVTVPLAGTALTAINRLRREAARRAALRGPAPPEATVENVTRGVAGLQGNVAGLATQQAQREANALKAAMKRAENLRKAQHNKGAAAVGEFFEMAEGNAERQRAQKRNENAAAAAEIQRILSNNYISKADNFKLKYAANLLMGRQPLNQNKARKINAQYRQLHRGVPNFRNAPYIKKLRAAMRVAGPKVTPSSESPRVNTSTLATTLARAIKAALAKTKVAAPPPKNGAPPPINTRSLASTLAAAIKKALGARKATAGINTRGLVAALTIAIKKALVARKGPGPNKGPVNTSALASALARAISGALATRKTSATTGVQTEEPARQARMGQEEAAPPKINRNSLTKALTNALKRAFTPATKTSGGEEPAPPLGPAGPKGRQAGPPPLGPAGPKSRQAGPPPLGPAGPKGRQAAPPPLGPLGPRGRQAGPAGVNVTTTMTGPSITGPSITGPSITGPTITVGAPNIKIQLNGLVKATEQARNNPNKVANLMQQVANLKARLGNGTEAKKALNTLFPKNAPPPTPEAVKNVVSTVIAKEEAKKQAAKEEFKPTPPPPGKSIKNMSFGELLSMRRSAKNRTEINRYLRQDVEKELKKIERMSSSERGWRLGELYKSLPDSLSSKARVARAIQAEIRRAGRERDPIESERRLRDLYGNLGMGRKLPRELSREFKIQNTRARTNYRLLEERRARKYGYNYGEGRGLRQGRLPSQYQPRPGQQVALRQAASVVKMPRSMEPALRQGGARALPSIKGPQVFAGPKALVEGVSLKLPTGIRGPVLPSNQQSAITKVGGPTQALKVVAAVPGGAPAVARAAADLNEMSGNVKKARELKGTPMAAIKAVQKLGGATTASYALEGLNTLAQSKKTQARKAVSVAKARKASPGKRVKKAPVRLHELNKVIEAVKRKKLVSLVAHNVTHTNSSNINNKKKKYYKKVIKSFILKKPLAAKVQAAAKKNKS